MKQQKIRHLTLTLLTGIMLVLGSTFIAPKLIYADQHGDGSGSGFTSTGGEASKEEGPKFVKSDCQKVNPDASNCGIIKYLLMFINTLSAIVGVVIVISIIVGGIQYSAAADNPQAAIAAKKRIGNAVLALLVFIFMFGFLQWLVPGGLFR